MERAQFTEPGTCWLSDRETTDYRITELRLKLGELHGWNDQWWNEQKYLDELYTETENTKPQLLRDLDNATEVESQLRWLEETYQVIRELRSPKEAAAPEGGKAEPPVQEPVSPPAAIQEPAAEWDESWGMLYRVLPSGEYQFAFSDDHKTVRAGTDWMSREVAAAGRDAGAAALEAPSAAIEEVLSEVGADVADLAKEMGLSEQEVAELMSDPELEQMVADEVAKLTADQG